MVSAKPCGHTIETLLSILARKTFFIEGADKPIWRLIDKKGSQSGIERYAITIVRCFKPFHPLFWSIHSVQVVIESPNLPVFIVVLGIAGITGNGEISGHEW